MCAFAAVLFAGGLLAVASLGTAQPPESQKGVKRDKGNGDNGDKGAKDNKGDKGFPNRGPGQFGPPPLGQIMPVFVQDQLKLTDAQKKDLAAMQKDVDAKLENLLTDDQKKTFKEMKDRGPRPGPGQGNFPGNPQQPKE